MKPTARITFDEIATIVEQSTEEGLLEDESGTVTATFEFSGKFVGDVEVPISTLVTLPTETTPADVQKAVELYGFSRYIVANRGRHANRICTRQGCNGARRHTGVPANQFRSRIFGRSLGWTDRSKSRMHLTSCVARVTTSPSSSTIGATFPGRSSSKTLSRSWLGRSTTRRSVPGRSACVLLNRLSQGKTSSGLVTRSGGEGPHDYSRLSRFRRSIAGGRIYPQIVGSGGSLDGVTGSGSPLPKISLN